MFSLLTNDLHAVTPHWEQWIIFNDGREVVQWNYVHTERVHIVILVRTTNPKSRWLIPLSGNDGPTGTVSWTPHLNMKVKRIHVSAKRLAALNNLRAQYQWIVESQGKKSFDYAINHKGELVKFPGLAE
jgi:hypothetical protein